MDTAVLSRGQSGHGVKLTANLHPVTTPPTCLHGAPPYISAARVTFTSHQPASEYYCACHICHSAGRQPPSSHHSSYVPSWCGQGQLHFYISAARVTFTSHQPASEYYYACHICHSAGRQPPSSHHSSYVPSWCGQGQLHLYISAARVTFTSHQPASEYYCACHICHSATQQNSPKVLSSLTSLYH